MHNIFPPAILFSTIIIICWYEFSCAGGYIKLYGCLSQSKEKKKKNKDSVPFLSEGKY